MQKNNVIKCITKEGGEEEERGRLKEVAVTSSLPPI